MAKRVEFIDPLEDVFDEAWLKSAFIIDVKSLQETAQGNIFSSTADRYFQDTSIGGNVSINPAYQFTRYADIPRKGRSSNRDDVNPRNHSHNIGMGRYYAHAIESNSDTLVLEFGVPEFQSIFSFFSRAVDYSKAVVARDGRSTFFYELGNTIGYFAQLVALNVTTILIYSGIAAYKTFFGNGDTRYYHMKPAMSQYWGNVNAIVTYMATDRGILLPSLLKGDRTRLGMPIEVDKGVLNTLHEMLPEIFTHSNYIDVFALSQRAQIMVNKQLLAETIEFRENRGTKDAVLSGLDAKTGKLRTPVPELDETPTYKSFLSDLNSKGLYRVKEDSVPEIPDGQVVGDDHLKADNLWTYAKLPVESASTYIDELYKYTESTVKGGGKYLILTVEHIGTVTDSFTNSIKNIPSESKLNSLGSGARDMRFSLSGGNILGDAVKDVTNAVKDVAMGTLDSLTFGLSNVIHGLLGGATITMPKMWDDSSTNVSKITYKVNCTPPYGNHITQVVDIDIILASILAGMLPQQVGQSSYTSPFLCKAFLRGRQNIDFGMITECTVKKGVNNIPYNKDGRTLGVEISFVITDFSEVVAGPVSGGIFGSYAVGLDENNPLNKFLSTFVARDHTTSRYVYKKGLIQATRAAMGISALTSPAYLGLMAGDSVFGRAISDVLPNITSLYLRDQK